MEFHTLHLGYGHPGWTDRDVYRHEIAVIRYAEEAGYDGCWAAEHHFKPLEIIPSTLTFLGHIAGTTNRIKIGSAVVVAPLHHPLRIAEDAAELDILSGGRLMFGIGRGYQAMEFEGYGAPIGESRARTDEALDIVRLAWTSDRFSFDGPFHTIEN